MDSLLTNLLETLHQTPRPVDDTQIIKAWEFAYRAHLGQKRLSGEPYIIHPTAVAQNLAGWNMDTITIVAGLLHDTIEDSSTSLDTIQGQFGQEVAAIVDGVTDITNIRLTGSRQDKFIENLRKMILVMAKDLRVVMVKLADRLHNMQTLKYLSSDKQYVNALETLDVYAPLAERLGMGEVKAKLDDLSFPYVYPQQYTTLVTQLHPYLDSGHHYVNLFQSQLQELLLPDIPQIQINIRQKHLYSIFTKLQRPEVGGDLNKIHDLFAARIIVDTVGQCYQALGLIHNRFHPVPSIGVSDYIANPKPNGYQSLHTKVFGPGGLIFEIQIRTLDMHQQAELGVASHWYYSEVKSTSVSDQILEKQSVILPDRLSWVTQLADWQQQVSNNSEYLQELKIDGLQHRILVFSPKGDVYDLPVGATPVDFAFAVHTDMGSKISGAKVNGKMVELNYQLRNGDLVEIMIDKNRKTPNPDWLNFVVTHSARYQITKSTKI